MTFLLRAAALCILVTSASAIAQTSPLRSPWDTTPVALTDKPYRCPTTATLPRDITATSFYSDSHHSITDPQKYDAYKQAQAPFDDIMVATARAADDFRSTGSKPAAACVLSLLDAQAAAGSMTGAMSSNQAYYVQNWTLGALAVAWLKVRDAQPGTPAERAATIQWMAKVAVQVRAYFEPRHARPTNDGTNNHFYWAGFAVMGAGIAANDRALYDWGASTYDEALSRIQPDGTLPLEMDRAQRALHYHLFALAPIIMLAEFGEANGQHFYERRNGAIHLLVKRTVAGVIDNSYFAEKAKAKQDTPAKPGELKSNDVLWLVPYLHRFPDVTANKVLHMADLHPYNYLGGYPPAYTK